ncbi:UNVERIFIED_CONTAM: hypothetical protein Sangu_2400400 [Sesamum angustifolium]|uniref:Chorein N-terminal domain-containing protein n=1 Tax=Sesamum angustifolium TaxID=2727405 RepID=A0AAW2KVP2_9LAMI
MESILARALEYTLKYWLKSFTRDQFKLQGRTVQLSNLDINGDALHASVGLPPALNVNTAKVGKLEIVLPSVSNVQVEPIVVQVDRLDLVLEENDDLDPSSNSSSTASTSSAKGSGYGFADKIADGMTLQIQTVNLLLETHGRAQQGGGATWASPMASITMRNLVLYTTNESWKVVNLKEARDFSSDKKFIYVFRKLEWEHLSVDLLPHPDMFSDANFLNSQGGSNRKDEDGAKRVFFGGERFVEGISGEAYITIQRTELNSPLGLEVQLHITEAVCPALSEPGLRALLRFFTGLNVCLNRGDVNPSAQQRSAEAAGRSLVSLIVDHIFLCIKDAEFQLELLMQSLFFSRVGLEGLQILKPTTAPQGLLLNGISAKQILQNGLPESEKPTVERCRGVNVSVDVVTSDEEIDDATVKWVVDKFKFSVNEPIEAIVKKDELQYLAFLFKSEVDSLGRIVAGVLRILKLEGSIGSAAISQLSNLGSESFDRIFTPENLSRRSSASTLGLSPSSNVALGNWSPGMESTLASLEEAVLDSKTKCAALAKLSCSESSAEYIDSVKQLSVKLESMQKLLNQFKSQL